MSEQESQNITPLLPRINSAEDLRKLKPQQLPQVCREIREYLISQLSTNPGHFGSSMGAVDIIVALHYVYNTPRDRIVFDVGHQAYAHKLITGRREEFVNQRKQGGISGFPTPIESPYDTFVCGHAGNSISAALGMAIADMNTPGQEDRQTVALIGDASISNGLAFEGLNNTSNNPNNLLIILNDNDMSIDPNVGALHTYLSELTTSAQYNNLRFKLYNIFKRKGLINDSKKKRVLRFGNALKSLISQQQNIFEGLNIRYFGPFNGNDVEKLVKTLQEIKDMKGPRILHVHTTKGFGYQPAEKEPSAWHAPGKFIPQTGKKIKSEDNHINWQQVFGKTLVELAKEDERVVGITAAMPSGTSIDMLQKEMPERVYDVGIAEGHAVTFAGGLATSGKRPFLAVYSSFLQRAYDNIIHDVAIQGLPVTFCIDRAGIVGEDGVTHHGLFDIATSRIIPGMIIASPADANTLSQLMYTALHQDKPMLIRYPRGKSDALHTFTPLLQPIEIGKGQMIVGSQEAKTAILTVGPILEEAKKAAMLLKQQNIEVSVYDMIWVKPIDKDLLQQIARQYDHVVTVEDGVRTGGFGSAVEDTFEDMGIAMKVSRLGVPDKWILHGSVPELRAQAGYDAASIVAAVDRHKNPESDESHNENSQLSAKYNIGKEDKL